MTFLDLATYNIAITIAMTPSGIVLKFKYGCKEFEKIYDLYTVELMQSNYGKCEVMENAICQKILRDFTIPERGKELEYEGYN